MRDIFGMFLSFLCIFHCIGLPFFLPLLKNAGIDFGIDEHTVHMSLLGIVVLYTATFLWPYANKVRFALSLFGLGFLFAALSFPEGTIETVITIVGSLILMTAHLLDFESIYEDEEQKAKNL